MARRATKPHPEDFSETETAPIVHPFDGWSDPSVGTDDSMDNTTAPADGTLTLVEKWVAFAASIKDGALLIDALASVGWDITFVPTPPKPKVSRDWRVSNAKRAETVQNKIKNGEAPFTWGTKQATVYNLLMQGAPIHQFVAAGLKDSGEVSVYVNQTSKIVGLDLIKTKRKGTTWYKFDMEQD
jgi:hypothetical protein